MGTKQGKGNNQKLLPEKVTRDCHGVDVDTPVKWQAHQIHEANRMTTSLVKYGLPYVLFPMRDKEGRRVVDDDGNDVLTGQQTTPRFIAGLKAVCTRLPEWVPSTQAKEPIPPCLSCYYHPEIDNCDEETVKDCSLKAVGLKGKVSPDSLAKALAERAKADRIRGEANDYDAENERTLRDDEPW